MADTPVTLTPLYFNAIGEARSVSGPTQARQRTAPHAAQFTRTAADLTTKRRSEHDSPPGCTARKQRGFAVVLGALSHCLGGPLNAAEREVMMFDTAATQRSAAAALALREDPRQLNRVPISASAGLSVPLTQHTRIGVEYSFSEAGSASPFHFRSSGRPADEWVGHSATVRVGLSL